MLPERTDATRRRRNSWGSREMFSHSGVLSLTLNREGRCLVGLISPLRFGGI
jgi:hypothetical protein